MRSYKHLTNVLLFFLRLPFAHLRHYHYSLACPDRLCCSVVSQALSP